MTDPTGRSAPGEINALLIWQQPVPFYLAETEYRSSPNNSISKTSVLLKWDRILHESAEFMASYAYRNSSTGYYDLGPPLHSVSENTPPNSTSNPIFELAFWKFGLTTAINWKLRLNSTASIPEPWTRVRDNLHPLPVQNGTYVTYPSIPDMWVAPETTFDHPGMAGIFGLLPPTPDVDVKIVRATADKIRSTWRLEESYGWDFAMLAINELRLGRVDGAMSYLLHEKYEFDDAGYPVGGERVPTPYFPNAAGFLVAMGMMAGGWEGDEGPKGKWPKDWEGLVEVEGFVPAL